MIALAMPALTMAQTPFGGFMKGKGKGDVVISYNSESYDQVFLVPQKINGVPVFNKVQINSVNLFSTIGISKKLDLQMSIPYVKATGAASPEVLTNLGYSNERKGLQDVSLYLKYNPLNCKAGKGNIAFIGALGLQAPLGNYKVDESLQSVLAIGNRATQLNTYIMAQYKLDMGLFLNGSLGYSSRSGVVPDATLSQLKVGYAGKAFYVDVFVASQESTSGVDILKEGFTAVFPATKVSYQRAGASLFVPVGKGFGVTAGYSTYLNGRNIGQSSGGNGGLVYSF